MDVLSLLPLDLLYLIFGTEYLMLRIPRLLKVRFVYHKLSLSIVHMHSVQLGVNLSAQSKQRPRSSMDMMQKPA
jgi:hypothetical protein